MDSVNPFTPLFEGILGSYFLGIILSTGLYGASCMQTFFYYVHYPDDPLALRLFVGVVWALNTIASAVFIAGVYKYIIATLLNPLAIAQVIPELLLATLSNVVAILAQSFFIYRIYIFSGKNIVAPILWALQAIYQLVSSTFYVARGLYTSDGRIQTISYSQLYDRFNTDLVFSDITSAAVVDVLIAIAMTYLLFKQRAAADFQASVHILQRLTVFAVGTGIWTATFAVLAAILLRVLPQYNLLGLVFAIPLASLYCNALLVNLNARIYIRGEAFTRDLVVMSEPPSAGNNTSPRTESTNVLHLTPMNILNRIEAEANVVHVEKNAGLELGSA